VLFKAHTQKPSNFKLKGKHISFRSKDKLKLHEINHVIEPELKHHKHKHRKSKKKHKKSKKKNRDKEVPIIHKPFKIRTNKILTKIKRNCHYKNGTAVNSDLNSTGTHKCKYCSSRFTSPWNLKVHLQTIHENIRPFQCHQCDKSFKQKIHLLGHFNSTHSNLKPFRCDDCAVKFAKKWNLFDHVKKYHSYSEAELNRLKFKYSKRRR